ncbi:hypothetical protein ABFS82_11G136100 [Erythranthe guttata]|uniref:Protein kinase domain-containing protein n=1 Tax=Erythranthe guttata TaxID=4155 RepID=A0A022R3J6_ERYGU|nr:PREDICTED: protein LYK2 [Erythranthe guttata]EYU34796.1 hypothetical protein MIMGU_mgv1a026546mg [Erythranthe guttata]|eukprot:XP_012840736.1 PREDICTED: protein LYK2 [Erythranthe guttata]
MITKKLELRAFVSFNLVILSVIGQNLLNCDTTSQPEYICDPKKPQQNCNTFAILRANSHYSSLSNLSSYLGIARSDLLEANGFSKDTEFFSNEQPILIPIDCECNSNSGFFEAQVTKSTTKGESFYEIVDSLEGLTTCNAIKEKNPSVSPWNLVEKINLLIPFKCACPSSLDLSNFLLSYPVKQGDTLAELASKFNVSQETLVSANNRHSTSVFRQDNNNSLVPFSTLLIPSKDKPFFGFLAQPSSNIRVRDSHKRRKHKMWMIGVYIAIAIIALLACIAIGAAFAFIQMKRKKDDPAKNGDLELQQLSLSVRTTSDKKVSFEGSQYNFEDQTREATTPHKTRAESYTFEELQKATEDFNSNNLIEGSVYHGRLNGKNLAIKRVPLDTIAKIDQQICYERIHHHPNTIRMLGTCLIEDCPDSYIVFEYARNGSLKDWIHGGLAIKSHFIASCSCFLTWNQRVKICLDVATALQYMHHIMNPSYVHSNIKSRNIFLDEDFSAKVGNFGMSKCIENQESSNKGYLAPECITNEGAMSASSDVFAFGVILLEVLSGKPPVKWDEEKGDSVKLCDEVKGILVKEDVEELRGWIDGALGENYSFDGAVMLANLARSCVEEEPCSRPSAGEIVEKMLRLVEELPEGGGGGDDGHQLSNVCESSCRPLVHNNNNNNINNADAKGM